MTNPIPLLVGAALVGVLHMSAPDHWVTICLLGKVANWSRRKLLGISLTTAVGHSIFSATLGLGIALVGLVFSKLISHYLSLTIGLIMLAVGLLIGLWTLVFKKKGEVTPGEKLLEGAKTNNTVNKGIGYFAVLGAALSPDLSITPIFLASIPVGLLFALYLFIIFMAASILSQLVLVEAGSKGLGKAFERIPEKYNDSIVGFVIAAIGIYILIAG
jgi:hypothetical protein